MGVGVEQTLCGGSASIISTALATCHHVGTYERGTPVLCGFWDMQGPVSTLPLRAATNLRTTSSHKCAVVSNRARMQGSETFAPLNSWLESKKQEGEEFKLHFYRLLEKLIGVRLISIPYWTRTPAASHFSSSFQVLTIIQKNPTHLPNSKYSFSSPFLI